MTLNPEQPLDIEAMACTALDRVQQSISASHAYWSVITSLSFQEALEQAERRTRRAMCESMLIQGRAWRVPKFEFYRHRK